MKQVYLINQLDNSGKNVYLIPKEDFILIFDIIDNIYVKEKGDIGEILNWVCSGSYLRTKDMFNTLTEYSGGDWSENPVMIAGKYHWINGDRLKSYLERKKINQH